MFWEDKAKQRTAARWVVSVFTACVLIYLGVGNLTVVTGSVSWAMGLVQPLLLGAANCRKPIFIVALQNQHNTVAVTDSRTAKHICHLIAVFFYICK